ADDAGTVGTDAVRPRIEDRAALRGERDITLRLDEIDLEVADQFHSAEKRLRLRAAHHVRDEDALRVASGIGIEGGQHAKRRTRLAVQFVYIDLEEVVGRADAALAGLVLGGIARDLVIAGDQRDVDAADIGIGASDEAVVDRIDNPRR